MTLSMFDVIVTVPHKVVGSERINVGIIIEMLENRGYTVHHVY